MKLSGTFEDHQIFSAPTRATVWFPCPYAGSKEVPAEGVEAAHTFVYKILSLARLPISPRRLRAAKTTNVPRELQARRWTRFAPGKAGSQRPSNRGPTAPG